MKDNTHLSEPDFDIEISVEWAPAYELVVSFTCFLGRRLHPLIDLGTVWARHVRAALPSDFNARVKQLENTVGVTGKSTGKFDDLFWLLVHVCPAERDVAGFLSWFDQLSTGDAYEALATRLPLSGAGLPRDFRVWRDLVAGLLHDWQTSYFATVDPAILDGLRREADALQLRLGSVPPRVLIEQVTNGVWVEPTPALRKVVLVPQYHCRPFNDFGEQQDGLIVLYACDVLPTPASAPPTGLLRLTRGLADESRLRILRFLGSSGPSCTLTEVARFAGLSQPTVHHHLTQLRAAGLVRVHVLLSGATRYSLSPHALGALANQLGAYLQPEKSEPEKKRGNL